MVRSAEREVKYLVSYRERLLQESTLEGKIGMIVASETVQAFMNSKTDLVDKTMPSLSKTDQYLIKAAVVCGQQHVFSKYISENPESNVAA